MFLRYAAKDVEDLIEVKEKMLNELNGIVKNEEISNSIAIEISRSYADQGCNETILGYFKELKKFAAQIPDLFEVQ